MYNQLGAACVIISRSRRWTFGPGSCWRLTAPYRMMLKLYNRVYSSYDLRSLESTIQRCQQSPADCLDREREVAIRKKLLATYSRALAHSGN